VPPIPLSVSTQLGALIASEQTSLASSLNPAQIVALVGLLSYDLPSVSSYPAAAVGIKIKWYC
jgi:hypothetical protein